MLVVCKSKNVCLMGSCSHYNPHEHHQVDTVCGAGACSNAHPDKVIMVWCIEYNKEEPSWEL